MHNEIFIDGITEITVTGPTIRIDAFTVSPSERDNEGNPKPIFRQRIIMTVEGFMNARDLIERVARELIEGGVVRRRDGVDQSEPPKSRGGSPNFPSTHS